MSSGPTHSASGRSISCSRVTFSRRGKGVIGAHDPAAQVIDDDHMRDRVERIFELAARPLDVLEELHVLDCARQLAAELVRAIEQRQLAPGFDPHTVEHDRAERPARAAERHGQRPRRPVVGGGQDVRPIAPHGRRRRRQRIVGADPDLAGQRFGRRRRLQQQLARAAIVNPDGGPVRAEQPFGPEADDLEARGQVQRGAQRQRELVEQLAQIALQFLVLAQAEQLQCGHERVRDLAGVDARHLRRGTGEADREQARTLAAGAQREEQRARRAKAG